MREAVVLCGLFFKTKWFDFWQERQARRRFPLFSPYAAAFKKAYRFSNPFQICKQFLLSKNESQVDAYGETPLAILARIVEECSLNEEDHVLEMGCGRGLGAFFLSHRANCSVTGVDFIPTFIERARSLAQQAQPPLKLRFLCQNMLDVDLSGISCIYLYGTCLSDPLIEQLIDRFKALESSIKIVTVSYPLSDYSSSFYTVKQWRGSFQWGDGEIYLNQLVKAAPSSQPVVSQS